MHSLYPQLPNAQVNNVIVPIVIGQIEFIMEISISLTPDVMHTCALLSYNACKPVSEINRSEFLIPKYYSKQIYCIATIYNNPSISQLYLFTLHSNSFVLWLYLYIQLTHSKMATVLNIWLFSSFRCSITKGQFTCYYLLAWFVCLTVSEHGLYMCFYTWFTADS